MTKPIPGSDGHKASIMRRALKKTIAKMPARNCADVLTMRETGELASLTMAMLYDEIMILGAEK